MASLAQLSELGFEHVKCFYSTELSLSCLLYVLAFNRSHLLPRAFLSCRYFTDVSHLPAVSAAIQQMNQSTGRIAAAVTKALEGWRVHSHIWKANKDALITKLQVGLLTIFIQEQPIIVKLNLTYTSMQQPICPSLKLVH